MLNRTPPEPAPCSRIVVSEAVVIKFSFAIAVFGAEGEGERGCIAGDNQRLAESAVIAPAGNGAGGEANANGVRPLFVSYFHSFACDTYSLMTTPCHLRYYCAIR